MPTYVAITGGEPTIRKDLPEIIQYIHDKHPFSEIKLLSNGRMFSYRGYAKEIAKKPISKFIIPVHAHCFELHDFIARSKGSFKQCINGVKNLLNLNSSVEIRMVIHGMNYPFIRETVELIRKMSSRIPIVLLYFDLIGSGSINKERLVVKMKKVVPYIEDTLDQHRQAIEIYHFPRCLFRKEYRDNIKGQTVEDRRIVFLDRCKECKERKLCAGIWKTYYHYKGAGEFVPIK
jgi:MoaA/NifB/PqqE/SkfB family radical SAM enzyme